MQKNVVSIILILSTVFKISFGQEELKEELLNPSDLIEDFDYMLKTLEETHPNLYAYIPEEEFTKKTDEINKQISKWHAPQKLIQLL